MSVTVPISFVRDFYTSASPQAVYTVLADVPLSISHFPNVERLVPLGDDKYRWEMARMGTQNYYFQIQYVTRYSRSDSEKWVRWEPIAEGNGSFKGCWEIVQEVNRTRVHFENEGHLELPLPRLARRLITPFVLNQFNELMDVYLANLQRTFAEGRS